MRVSTYVVLRTIQRRHTVCLYPPLSFSLFLLVPGRRWQCELPPGLFTLEVVIEKVHVQQRLQDTTNVYHPVMFVPVFKVGSIDPIEDVQGTVGTHKEDVISGQVFHLPITLQHHELGEDRYRFQVDGEGPQELNNIKHHPRPRGANQMRNKCQHETGSHGKLVMQEGILRLIVRGLDGFLITDRVNDRGGGNNVYNLHEGIVYGIERCE